MKVFTIGVLAALSFGLVPEASAQRIAFANPLSGKHPAARIHQDTEQPAGIRGGGIANDNCANAVALVVNAPGACPGQAVAGDNFGANSDNGTPACDVSDTGFEDVWYSFNSGTNTSVTISVTLGDMEDQVLEVLQGGCAGTSVYCSYSTLDHTVTVTPGTNYLVRVASNNDFGAGGTFTICITGSGGGGSAPANDQCANAATIGVDATCVASPGTTENATQSLAPASCSSFTASVANDVWYTFTATAASTTIAVTGAGDATTGMDPVLEAFSGTCAALTSLGCVDATGRAGTETLTLATTPGSVYRYRVYYWPYAGQSVFGFTTCVTASAGGPGYCTAGADGTGLGLDERIVNVTFAGINNNSPDAAPVAPAYSDFTSVTGTVQQGQSYPIGIDVARVGANTSYSENQVIVWIDWNQDSDFNDAGEQVFVSAIGSVDIYTGTIAVPAGAPLGTTRMRVRLHDTHDGSSYTNNFNDTPCGLASYGEVEDYTINVTAGGGTTPPNDDCTGAVAVALSTPGSITLSGDNTGATIDPPTQFVVVWEAFTISECSNITLNFCQPGSVFTAFFVSLATACPLDIVGGIINGANDECNVYFFGLAPGTYYIPVRVEADGSTPVGAYSVGVTAEPCANPGPYCEAGADATVEEKISNVTFAGINNDSASPAGYEDFTTLVASVVGGQSYPISITVAGGYSTDQGIVWIDWNQDNDFEDAGEQVLISAAGAGPYTGTVNVPLTATEGPTRMRVRLHDTYTGAQYANTPNATPCGNSTYGQVEDYTVDVIGIITGLNGADEAAFAVYPNPTDGPLTIRTGGLSGNVRFEVLDALGRVAYSEQRVVSKASSVALNLGGRLAPGAYLLRLVGGDAAKEERIIIR